MRDAIDLAARLEGRRLPVPLEGEIQPPDERRDDDEPEHDEPGRRMDEERRDERHRGSTDRRDEGDDDAHLDVDLVVEIAHDTGEQIGASASAQPGGRERQQLTVGRRAPLGEVGQRRVVRDEPLDVPEDGASDAERAHRDDRRQQREDDGALARAHDEPAGRRRQRHAAGERESADEARDDDAAHRHEQRAAPIRARSALAREAVSRVVGGCHIVGRHIGMCHALA